MKLHNIYIISIISFLFILLINTEMVLFLNSELLINIILFLLIIFVCILSNLHNFLNLLFYSTKMMQKDSILIIFVIIFILKKYILYNYRLRIKYIFLINQIDIFVNKKILKISKILYKIFLFNILKFLNVELYLILRSSIPSCSQDINSLAIISSHIN